MIQLTLDGGRFYSPTGRKIDPFKEPIGIVVRSKTGIPSTLVNLTKKVIDKYFPEINGVYLYRTDTVAGRYLKGWRIALNPQLEKENTIWIMMVIAHELTHLIQYMQDYVDFKNRSGKFSYLYKKKIPCGEKSCDIYTYARHPDLIWYSCYLECNFPDLTVKKNRTIVHKYARESIEMRDNGERYYIKWFENKMNELSINNGW